MHTPAALVSVSMLPILQLQTGLAAGENVFTKHVLHTLAADPENLPAVQPIQALLPTVAVYLPATQLTQVASEEAPTFCEYLPVEHKPEHAALPINILYFPAAHFAHAESCLLKRPSAHTQSSNFVLPGGELSYNGQDPSHGPAPPVFLKVPAEHNSQGPPFGPKEPSLHTREHDSMDVLPGGDVWALSSASTGQTTQAALPRFVLYVPIRHCEQNSPLFPVHPALHWQAVCVILPTREIEFVGQAKQVVPSCAL